MRARLTLLGLGVLVLVQSFAAQAQPVDAGKAREVRILATGGTIASTGGPASASYRPGGVSVADLVAALPGVEKIAPISAEQISNVGSSDIDEAIWRKLLDRVMAAGADPAVSGIVITHGTDTMEETAFFLSLLVPSAKPVVLVGSMRPANAVSADGPQNMLDAVRVAHTDAARGRGVMVVMNDTIFDPMSVTKLDVHQVNAFASPKRGPIGQVLTPVPVFFAAAAPPPPAFRLTSAKLPKVAIAYAYAGFGADDVRAAAQGADGLIIAGVGAGNFSKSAIMAVKELTARGFPVVRTPRQGAGDIWREDAQAGERSEDILGTIAGRELTPAKARILLMLALQQPRTRAELQAIFDRLGTTSQ
jgi:L-asparaginase